MEVLLSDTYTIIPVNMKLENEQYRYLLKCNIDKNVHIHLTVEKNYLLLLPKKEIIMHVKCASKGLLSADIKIISMTKNGEIVNTYNNHYIAYEYHDYDKIHFDSFRYKDSCLIYKFIK